AKRDAGGLLRLPRGQRREDAVPHRDELVRWTWRRAIERDTGERGSRFRKIRQAGAAGSAEVVCAHVKPSTLHQRVPCSRPRAALAARKRFSGRLAARFRSSSIVILPAQVRTSVRVHRKVASSQRIGVGVPTWLRGG